ncbi:DnaJ C-terminal domain-containing protein [Tropheryma whipplei]|uniref:DnaJ C-terminal domain-containing protein n=1 Tax=Tropheryma whipplei TaxID=2039 RepID=UPI0004B3E577|nr:J domain-containing protein [Tropheryma whipplei]
MVSQDWLEKDFYAVLDVDSGVSGSQISKAYRKLARRYHPDSNPGSKEAEARFKEISEAYTVLSDPVQREEYDQLRNQKGAFTTGDFGDIFSNLFTGHRSHFAPSGGDIATSVKVSLESIVLGDYVNMQLSSGETLRVKIPSGIGNGERFRVRGKGAPSPYGGPSGDLIVTVNIRPHPVFELDGKDLRMNLPITFVEAFSGAVIEVPTMQKQTVKIKIQPGTLSGMTLRIKGRGVQSAQQPGDLLAVVQIVPPKNTDDVRKIIEQLAAKTAGDNPRRDVLECVRDSDP